jgi:excisionase family DNA binding protein
LGNWANVRSVVEAIAQPFRVGLRYPTMATNPTKPPKLTSRQRHPILRVMQGLLQVREAANALGVHENTLRRWEEKGYLQAVKLPTGVRRFRAEDIRGLRERMFSGFAPLHNSDELDSAADAKPID